MLELYSPYLLDWGEHLYVWITRFYWNLENLELFWSTSYSESETNDEDRLLLDESS